MSIVKIASSGCPSSFAAKANEYPTVILWTKTLFPKPRSKDTNLVVFIMFWSLLISA